MILDINVVAACIPEIGTSGCSVRYNPIFTGEENFSGITS